MTTVLSSYPVAVSRHRECGGWVSFAAMGPREKKHLKNLLYDAFMLDYEVQRLPPDSHIGNACFCNRAATQATYCLQQFELESSVALVKQWQREKEEADEQLILQAMVKEIVASWGAEERAENE